MKQKLKDKTEESYLEFLLNESNELVKSLMNNYYVSYNGLGIKEREISLMEFHNSKRYEC